MISAIAETSESSIEEIKFHFSFFQVMKFLKKEKIWPKMHFLVFAPFVGNFSNKHHYNLLKILRIYCFWYFCPKRLFSKLFVLKVDLCIKVVALFKITIVYYVLIFEFPFSICKEHTFWDYSLFKLGMNNIFAIRCILLSWQICVQKHDCNYWIAVFIKGINKQLFSVFQFYGKVKLAVL